MESKIKNSNSKNNNVTFEEIHDIVFKILLEIDRICRKNDIPYALAFGSALGAKVYKDFIPWDDDADIAINYFDKQRLIEAFKNDLSDEFVFDSFEVNKRFNVLTPAIKVKYKNSKIIEHNHFFMSKNYDLHKGIFVDICCFMGVPSNKRKHKRLFIKSKLMMPIMLGAQSIFNINPKCMKNRLLKYEEKMAKKYKDSECVSQTVIIPFQELPKKMVKHLSFSREVIYPFKEVEFHGHSFYSFNKMDEFCLLRYGEFKEPKNKNSEHLKHVEIF